MPHSQENARANLLSVLICKMGMLIIPAVFQLRGSGEAQEKTVKLLHGRLNHPQMLNIGVFPCLQTTLCKDVKHKPRYVLTTSQIFPTRHPPKPVERLC